MELIELFTKNLTTRQKQYEAVRAVAFQEGSIKEIASKFGYSSQALRNLINKVRKGNHQFFPEVKPGPKGRQTSQDHIEIIIMLRKQQGFSSKGAFPFSRSYCHH